MNEKYAVPSTIGANLPRSQKLYWRIFDLHTVLVLRDIRSRYRATVLGVAWTVINPILFAAVLIFLLQYVLEMNSSRFSSYVYSGVLVYGWFRGGVSQATRSVVSSGFLARRPGFPPAVLPLVPVTTNLFDFLLSLPVLGVVLAVGGSELSWALVTLPLLIAIQYMVIVGVSYIAAAGHLIFRDTGYVVDLMLTVGFFLTPIFFALDQIPDTFKPYFWLNPLVPLLQGYREVLIYGNWPSASVLFGTTIVAALLVVAGWYAFRVASSRYIENV
jgi:lipopolysaccharide transport system permease protein